MERKKQENRVRFETELEVRQLTRHRHAQRVTDRQRHLAQLVCTMLGQSILLAMSVAQSNLDC
jgi:hypothetical protein